MRPRRPQALRGQTTEVPRGVVGHVEVFVSENIGVGRDCLASGDDSRLTLAVVEFALEEIQTFEVFCTEIQVDQAINPFGIVGPKMTG